MEPSHEAMKHEAMKPPSLQAFKPSRLQAINPSSHEAIQGFKLSTLQVMTL
jgi:hypothetical protein